MKEANMKKLHTVRFQLYDILEKATLWKQLKVQWLPAAEGEGGLNGCSTGDFEGTELYDTVIVDTCHHTFAKTHRMYSPKSEPNENSGLSFSIMY